MLLVFVMSCRIELHGKIGIAKRKLDTLLKILFLMYNSKQISCKETKLPSHMKREMLIKCSKYACYYCKWVVRVCKIPNGV